MGENVKFRENILTSGGNIPAKESRGKLWQAGQ